MIQDASVGSTPRIPLGSLSDPSRIFGRGTGYVWRVAGGGERDGQGSIIVLLTTFT